MKYVPTIGLEVHAELKTRTKMFCNSANDPFAAKPNVNICPVCMAHPGTLPVINREAVRHVLRAGAALGGTLANYTEFDRKNYFYPDLPKGYQLSQYAFPLVSGGNLHGVAITRIHLEEDTASSSHDSATGETRIDFNRAGVPLMELVTEPVIHSAKQAGDFGRELQLLLRYLGSSDADMEKGHMRLEANISVAPEGSPLGTKVEIKNINSFRAMERAIDFEIKRQVDLLETGGQIVQETRGWDDAKQMTFSQRVKEGSADYRYFPDPDLPSLLVSEIPEFALENLRSSLPELPWKRRARYIALGIKEADAQQFVTYPALGDFLDQVLEVRSTHTSYIQRAANYVANDLASRIRDFQDRDAESHNISAISPSKFSKIMDMLEDSRLSSRAAKDLIGFTIEEQRDPESIAKDRGILMEKSDSDLETVVLAVIQNNSAVVADYRAGKQAALQFLIGQGMKEMKGAANPMQLRASLLRNLG
jgi:aspartyl-tRNA(Asn)/glutamyl-tRNA(Gln) amidotransferase subunit B